MFVADVLQVAVPEITEAVKGAKILVFVIPHQFIAKLCDQIKPHITEGTIGISLIKVRSRHCCSCQISSRRKRGNGAAFSHLTLLYIVLWPQYHGTL